MSTDTKEKFPWEDKLFPNIKHPWELNDRQYLKKFRSITDKSIFVVASYGELKNILRIAEENKPDIIYSFAGVYDPREMEEKKSSKLSKKAQQRLLDQMILTSRDEGMEPDISSLKKSIARGDYDSLSKDK